MSGVLIRGRPRKKQGPKKGKVVRVSPAVWSLLERERADGETIDALVRRVLGVALKRSRKKIQTYFILPEAGIVCSSRKEALGAATLLFVRRGKRGTLEQPIEVTEVGR